METNLTRSSTLTTAETKLHTQAFRFLLLALVFAAGCGSSASSNDADQFVGNWVFDSTPLDVTCGGAALMPQDLAGTVLTLDRVSGSEVVLDYSANCMVHVAVSGSTASAKPNQTCQIATKQAGDQVVAVSSWTLTLDSPTSISTELKGTALLGMCTVSGSGKLSRTDVADGGAGG
jgi:hypothetical protein